VQSLFEDLEAGEVLITMDRAMVVEQDASWCDVAIIVLEGPRRRQSAPASPNRCRRGELVHAGLASGWEIVQARAR